MESVLIKQFCSDFHESWIINFLDEHGEMGSSGHFKNSQYVKPEQGWDDNKISEDDHRHGHKNMG